MGPSRKGVHTPWGLAKSVRFVDKGEGFPNCVRTHFSRRLFTGVTRVHMIKKCANICEK